ncbi:dynein heavy chain 5, axonemal-like [Notothenia coriiceps]|uniref:Dynein heavy chain 5, axonemal-like n=1 Tax=Notothenia coriiceps TaxID=8208 RepID=A0A6I9PHS3_9TELE|nr:PREDICTED: dynein heavy chain 5, axonemal-like [Notothenia coriiceps]
MADPEREQSPLVPPGSSSEPGLNSGAPSPDTELQAGGQEEVEEALEEGGADGALMNPKPPLLHLRRDVAGRGHRRIGGQNLRANNHIMSPPAAPSPSSSSSSSSSSFSGRRPLLLSSEERREMATQQRALKEERRAALDPRHRYLISRLEDAGTLGGAEVEDALISDDKFSLVEDFFAANGSKKLMFFYQDDLSSVEVTNSATDQRKLFLTTGCSERLLGKCLFFLRTTDKAITTANVQQEVNFGMLACGDSSLLSSVETLLTYIMLPALRSQQTWGSVQDGTSCPDVQSFLSSVDQFICNLSSARVNIERQFQLQQVDLPEAIHQLSCPADYTAAANNSELVEHLEGVVSMWTNQIKQVLTESKQIRKEADDVGPSAELEHWKRRMVTFNSLMEEVKRPEVKRTLGVLQVTKSRTLRTWRELDGDITVVANEAKDNVKFLYTLDKFFGPLGKCTPTRLLEHIPRLMSSIRMIHTISQYYNTSERMTSLLLKVTNQMITTCRSFLSQGVARIWDLSRPVLLQRISDCCKLNAEYQRSFQTVRDKLRENPESRQFDFSENYIFGKFDAFCRRLEKIADMASSLESLAALQHMKVEGIEKIYVRYQSIVSTTTSKTYDVLDHRKLEFDSDYADFQLQVHSLFQSLQSLLDFWCHQPLTKGQASDTVGLITETNAFTATAAWRILHWSSPPLLVSGGL